MMPENESIRSILEPIIGPWYESLKNPAKVQQQVLYDLLKKYGATDYGNSHGALQINGVEDYRRNFPVIDYAGLLPYFAKVKEGNYKTILSEPPAAWVMTRGSTGKSSKVLPSQPPAKTGRHRRSWTGHGTFRLGKTVRTRLPTSPRQACNGNHGSY